MALSVTKRKGPQKGMVNNPDGKNLRPKQRRVMGKEIAEADKKRGLLMPLDFMLSVMRDKTMPLNFKLLAAEKSAPYVHRKMPIAIEGGDRPITIVSSLKIGHLTTEELEALTTSLSKLGALVDNED